jgi:hypothetical protein
MITDFLTRFNVHGFRGSGFKGSWVQCFRFIGFKYSVPFGPQAFRAGCRLSRGSNLKSLLDNALQF